MDSPSGAEEGLAWSSKADGRRDGEAQGDGRRLAEAQEDGRSEIGLLAKLVA